MHSFDSFNHAPRHGRHPGSIIRMAAVLMVLFSMLPLQHLIGLGTAQAAICAAGGVVITDNISATSSAGALIFYEDTGITPPLRGMYVGYTITNNAATTGGRLIAYGWFGGRNPPNYLLNTNAGAAKPPRIALC